MKFGFDFYFGVGMFAWGLTCILFPQWWYKQVSAEQVARDRKRFKTLGYILTPLGLVLLLIHFLTR